MTGKELKEFAALLPDACIIEVREKGYSGWNERFTMRAVIEYTESTPDVPTILAVPEDASS